LSTPVQPIQLKLSDGDKVEFHGLSRNKGVVWIKWAGGINHICLSDLDSESQARVQTILEETLAAERAGKPN
jgi:hypothetical protein